MHCMLFIDICFLLIMLVNQYHLCIREHVDMIFKLVTHKFDWQVRYI
jgi:hypothetical protein